MKTILNLIEKNKLDMLELHVSESKISITFKETIADKILEEIHKKLINKE